MIISSFWSLRTSFIMFVLSNNKKLLFLLFLSDGICFLNIFVQESGGFWNAIDTLVWGYFSGRCRKVARLWHKKPCRFLSYSSFSQLFHLQNCMRSEVKESRDFENRVLSIAFLSFWYSLMSNLRLAAPLPLRSSPAHSSTDWLELSAGVDFPPFHHRERERDERASRVFPAVKIERSSLANSWCRNVTREASSLICTNQTKLWLGDKIHIDIHKQFVIEE